ncbi:MAG: glycosyltransferase [Christensenellales bacterium]
MEEVAIENQRENKIKIFFGNLWGLIKKDITTENADFKYIAIKMGIIAISLIISLFWAPFSYVVLLEAIVFSCFQLNGRALYYILFIMPFMQVFRCNPSDTYFLMYLCVAIVLTLGIKLLIDIIKKNKKINWFFTISFVVMLIFFSIPRGNGLFALRYWGSLVLGAAILFIAFYYKKDLGFKELVFSFAMGFLFACFLEVFRDVSRMPTMVEVYYSYGVKFTGAYINPNVLMGEGAFCLALLMLLFLNGKIRVIFYPLLVIITVCVLSTLSKIGFVVTVFMYLLFAIMLCSRKFSKKSTIKVICCIVLMIATLGMCHTQIAKCIGRFQDSMKNPEEISDIVNRDTTNDNVVTIGGKEVNLTEISTGRFDIWKCYFNKIFESPQNAIFGCGVGAPFIGEWQGGGGWQPHNTFIQALYYVGIFGYILMIIWFISSIDKEHLKKFNWFSILPVLALAIYLCDLEFFSFRLGVYVLLLCYGFTSEKESFIYNSNTDTALQKSNIANKIPKKIHYIWLGGKPLPKIAEKCIESWKKYCPDYEIIRWDESNVDLDCCEYCREAYNAKKFAFASDVLRFDILSKHGGIYLDIDVKLLKPLDDLLTNSCFMGFEQSEALNPGLLLACEKGNRIIMDLFESYKNDHFINEDGSYNLNTICVRTTDYMKEKGMQLNNSLQEIDGVQIYPTEYFCPLSPITDKNEKTPKTYAVHLYYASWFNKKAKLRKIIKKCLNFITNGWFGVTLYKLKKKVS